MIRSAASSLSILAYFSISISLVIFFTLPEKPYHTGRTTRKMPG